MFTAIENAASQVAIVRIMEESSGVLRHLHKQIGGVEGVEGVVDRLAEEMEKGEEVGRVLDQGTGQGVDEGDVEDELEEMERVEREKRNRVQAEETAKRLAELEGVEKERREQNAASARQKERAGEETSQSEGVEGEAMQIDRTPAVEPKAAETA